MKRESCSGLGHATPGTLVALGVFALCIQGVACGSSDEDAETGGGAGSSTSTTPSGSGGAGGAGAGGAGGGTSFPEGRGVTGSGVGTIDKGGAPESFFNKISGNEGW